MKVFKPNFVDISSKVARDPDGLFYLNIGFSYAFSLVDGTIINEQNKNPTKLFNDLKLKYGYDVAFDEVSIKKNAEFSSICTFFVDKKAEVNNVVSIKVSNVEKSLLINKLPAVPDNSLTKAVSIEPKNSPLFLKSTNVTSSLFDDDSNINGYWTLSTSDPIRKRYLGEFNNKWLVQDWPHLPTDTSPEYFQMCSSDQWLDGYIHGGEPIKIHNLNEIYPYIESSVPFYRPRIFVEEVRTNKTNFVELESNIDTLWLLPDVMSAILVSHSRIALDDLSASKINAIYSELDSLNNCLDLNDHHSNFLVRSGRITNDPEADVIQNAQTLPKNDLTRSVVENAIPVTHTDSEEALTANAIEDYINESKVGARTEFEADSSESIFDTEKFEQILKEFIIMNYPDGNLTADELKKCIEDGCNQLFVMLENAGITEEQLLAAALENPNLKNHALLLQNIPGGIAGLHSEFEKSIDNLYSEKPEIKISERDDHGGNQEHLVVDEELEQGIEDQIWSRQKIQSTYIKGVVYDSLDLSNIDLSNLTLDGSIFKNCDLTNTNFSNSSLVGGNFENVYADSALFSNSNLESSIFDNVSMASSDFSCSKISDSIFKNVNLYESNFDKSVLSNTHLISCDISKSKLHEISGLGLVADNVNFTESSFIGTNLTGGRFRKSIFFKADLSNCNLSDCNFSKADFSGADVSNCVIVGSILTDTQAINGTNFNNTKLFKSDISNSNWSGVSLFNANLDLIIANDTDFSNAILSYSSMINSVANRAIFDFASIDHCDFTGVNLFDGAMRGASLNDNKFEAANFFSVDFRDAKIVNVSFEGTELSRTILSIRK
jgi:uncharacterized protein YjbI with pentapeptide repeats